MTFLTEASIDLADDDELMQLMVDANIRDCLYRRRDAEAKQRCSETKKLQNLRKGGTMLEKIHTIQQTGMEVWCGMILGFDSDDTTIFEAQRVFIKDARIVSAMIGMLAAIPKTPLYTRLEKEGRLDHDDPQLSGPTSFLSISAGKPCATAILPC